MCISIPVVIHPSTIDPLDNSPSRKLTDDLGECSLPMVTESYWKEKKHPVYIIMYLYKQLHFRTSRCDTIQTISKKQNSAMTNSQMGTEWSWWYNNYDDALLYFCEKRDRKIILKFWGWKNSKTKKWHAKTKTIREHWKKKGWSRSSHRYQSFFLLPLHNPPTFRSHNVFNSATASSASSSQNRSSPRLSQIRPLMGMEPGTVSPFLATRTYLKKRGHE